MLVDKDNACVDCAFVCLLCFSEAMYVYICNVYAVCVFMRAMHLPHSDSPLIIKEMWITCAYRVGRDVSLLKSEIDQINVTNAVRAL